MDENNNGQLDQMEADRQNKLAEKSGMEALKRHAKKDKRKQMIKAIIKMIVAQIKAIMIPIILTRIIVSIVVSVFISIFGGDITRPSIFSGNHKDESRVVSLREYLQQFSHSGEAPQSDDGRFYKMYSDDPTSGWPTIGNSDLQWKSHQAKFACQGKVLKGSGENTETDVQAYVNNLLTRGADAKYSQSEIDGMGIYIEKDLVDSIGQTVAEGYYDAVVTLDTEGLDLSEQQLFALTAIRYNFGHLPKRPDSSTGNTFKEVYEEGAALYEVNSWEHMMYIWDNWWCYLGGGQPGHIPSRDAAFETFVKGVYDFTYSDAGEVFGRQYYIYYTQEQLNRFDYAPDLPITRNEGNEKELFTYVKNTYSAVTAGNLLDAAEAVHTKYEKELWSYSTSGLYYGDIRKSMEHPKKITCCATFVSEALYLSGLVTEEEINGMPYNGTGIHSSLLALEGRFMKITRYEDLEAGDIVFMEYKTKGKIGHVQIYAGNQTWYNAGSTSAIRKDSPYADSSYAKSKFIDAVRPLKGGSTSEED